MVRSPVQNAQETNLYSLQSDTTYEFRVGSNCIVELASAEVLYSYSSIQEFKTPKKGEDSSYNCGYVPNIEITNVEPLEGLGVNEVFTAGDFPVTVKEVNSENSGSFTGWGFIVVPYLADTRIKVSFSNIKINTDLQLIEGVVLTAYDPTWSGIDNIQDEIDAVTDAADAVADTVSDIIEDVFGEEPDEEETTDSDTTSDTDSSDTTSEGNTSDTNTEEENDENSDTTNDAESTNGDTNTTSDTNSNTSSTDSTATSESVFILYDGKQYKNGDVIEVRYKEGESNFAFLLKDYPENATFNWQVLYQGADYTAAYAQNEVIYDNFGIDMKSIFMLDIVVNYNDQKVQITIKRKADEFSLVDLYARQKNNEKRWAKTGEKLYLVNSPNTRKINYGVHISDDVHSSRISSQDIVWYYESPNTQTNLGKDYGKKKIERDLEYDENIITTTVEAGNPNSSEKRVDVEWIDRGFSRDNSTFDYGFDLMPYIEELARKFDVPVRNDKSDWDQDRSFSILADLSFQTLSENKEDLNSRLYFNEERQILKTKLGIKGKFEKPVPSLAIPIIDDSYLGIEIKIQAGIYFFIEANAYGEVGHTKFIEDWIEEKDKRNRKYTEYGNPAQIVLNSSIGLDPKLVLKLSDKIDGSISGKSDVYGQILRYDLKENKIEFPVLEQGIQLRCLPKAHFKIKINNFIKWSYTSQWDEYIYYLNWNEL